MAAPVGGVFVRLKVSAWAGRSKSSAWKLKESGRPLQTVGLETGWRAGRLLVLRTDTMKLALVPSDGTPLSRIRIVSE